MPFLIEAKEVGQNLKRYLNYLAQIYYRKKIQIDFQTTCVHTRLVYTYLQSEKPLWKCTLYKIQPQRQIACIENPFLHMSRCNLQDKKNFFIAATYISTYAYVVREEVGRYVLADLFPSKTFKKHNK